MFALVIALVIPVERPRGVLFATRARALVRGWQIGAFRHCARRSAAMAASPRYPGRCQSRYWRDVPHQILCRILGATAVSTRFMPPRIMWGGPNTSWIPWGGPPRARRHDGYAASGHVIGPPEPYCFVFVHHHQGVPKVRPMIAHAPDKWSEPNNNKQPFSFRAFYGRKSRRAFAMPSSTLPARRPSSVSARDA